MVNVVGVLFIKTLAGLCPLAQTLENPLQPPAEKEPVPSLSPFPLVKTHNHPRTTFFSLRPTVLSGRRGSVWLAVMGVGEETGWEEEKASFLYSLPRALFLVSGKGGGGGGEAGREDCHPLPAFGNFGVVAGMGCVCSREEGAMWTLRGGDAPGIG